MSILRSLSRWLDNRVRWGLRIILLLLIADFAYLTYIWPDWSKLIAGPIPKSNFIKVYEERRLEKGWPTLRWAPVSLTEVPKHLVRAVLVAEDSRFNEHGGLDIIAIKEAWNYNRERGQMVFGASTISQQTAKNLFLNSARNPVRKWHEIFLTLGLERNLSKQRILEIYLNTAEFGRGIYGVEAASQAYWGIPVARLSVIQAAELAATLPGPVKNNPATRSGFFLRHSKKILSLMGPNYYKTPVDPAESLDVDIEVKPDPEPEVQETPTAADPPAPAPMEESPPATLRTL